MSPALKHLDHLRPAVDLVHRVLASHHGELSDQRVEAIGVLSAGGGVLMCNERGESSSERKERGEVNRMNGNEKSGERAELVLRVKSASEERRGEGVNSDAK